MATLLLITLAATVFVWINVYLDLFGLFGKQNVKMHVQTRFSTYLLGQRSIGEHFDSLLLGNSNGSLYDTRLIDCYRTYNLALLGASMTEEKTLAEQVIRHGHIRMVLLVLSPSLLADHPYKSSFMTPHDYVASFGSIQTLITDFQVVRERLGRPGPITYDAAGRTHWPIPHLETVPAAYHQVELPPDPTEERGLREFLVECRQHGITVWAFLAPVVSARRDKDQQAWETHLRRLISSDARWLALPAAMQRSLESDRRNFPDFIHMSDSANALVMRQLSAELPE